jgi:two-component system sensor histidine kinase HydH
VSGVAHEVRNPLNSMKLTLQLLERKLKKGAPVSQELNEAMREIDRLDMIVGRLLAFGRPAMTNRQIQEVAPLVEQAIRMVQEPARKKAIRITTRGLTPGMTADVDGPQIVQILINLLLNAVDASGASDQVGIEAERMESGMRIAVADRGPGIPEEDQGHIFDAYFTTKPNGSGLGLAVSREIAANHGGVLRFETGPTGTTFLLELPAERSRPL